MKGIKLLHIFRIAALTIIERCYFIPDALYLRIQHLIATGKVLHLCNPKTFNDKLQWLKLYDRRPIYTIVADKISAKEYACKHIGEEFIVPTLRIFEDVDNIDVNFLPKEFVIKCTHDSGSIYICRNSENIDYNILKKRLRKKLKTNYFHAAREWAYLNITPRIIVEPLLHDGSNNSLRDYKFYCFGGKVKLIHVDINRFEDHRKNFYDPQWNRLDIEITFPKADFDIEKPTNLKQMIDFAECLSKDFCFIRVDFYEVEGHVYFSELTPYPGAGKSRIKPAKWNLIMGQWITLPNE